MAFELDSSGAAFGKQFKRAKRSGAVWAAVIGDEEAETGQLRLRPLLVPGKEPYIKLGDFAEVVSRFRISYS